MMSCFCFAICHIRYYQNVHFPLHWESSNNHSKFRSFSSLSCMALATIPHCILSFEEMINLGIILIIMWNKIMLEIQTSLKLGGDGEKLKSANDFITSEICNPEQNKTTET